MSQIVTTYVTVTNWTYPLCGLVKCLVTDVTELVTECVYFLAKFKNVLS